MQRGVCGLNPDVVVGEFEQSATGHSFTSSAFGTGDGSP
jgi:hypothetical protein